MTSPFLQHLAEQMRVKRYAKRTIQTYTYWIKAFINFNHQKHPLNCHDKEVEDFLSFLVNQLNLAPKTQGVALNALVFLYRVVLDKPLTLELAFNKSKQQTKLPVVLTKAEVILLLSKISSRYKLACQLMYGSGLRLMEVVRLRVQDIDFDYHALQVWQGKGGKNRRVTLATELEEALKVQISITHSFFKQDLGNIHYKGVWLPYALARKYPKANVDPLWHYIFPSHRLSIDPESKELRRHHIDETALRKAVKKSSVRCWNNKKM
jgi:integron integrase